MLSALAAVLALAAPPDEPEIRYNGAFVGVGVFGGASILQDQRWESPVGGVVGVYGRLASVLSLIDVQLEYAWSRNDAKASGNVPADLRFDRHGLAMSVNLHPMFLSVLGNDWASFALAAAYAQIGLSTEFTSFGSDVEPQRDQDDVAFSLHVGAGIDVPLGDASGASAFWLGLSWRWKFVYLDPPRLSGVDQPNETNTHSVVLAFSYRYQSLNFWEM
ncbi:MAG: hypothetical protein IV100_02210 [Myxococcales bacterium]|nr:hypothetical protein [Myxococcales bacterium]